MLDAHNLNYSYLEQSSKQIEELRKILIVEDASREKLDCQRLYRKNVFEDLDASERHHLDKLLIFSLETLGSHIDNALVYKSKAKPVLVVDRKSKSNYAYEKMGVVHLQPKNRIKFSTCESKKQALMLHVVAKVLDLLRKNTYMSNRELYYLSVEICRSCPKKLNDMIEDICCLLGCSKIHLHIVTQSKGLIYGDLKLKFKNGQSLNCLSNNEGVKLPNPKIPIIKFVSSAKFVIIVEKDSILQKIINQEKTAEFVKRYKVILFTARGYPDINSRAFINLLWRHLKIPILALTDADPHGFEIVCCYKFGCYATASEALNLAVPHIRWLGLLPSDVVQHSLPASSLIMQTEQDSKKILSLYKRPYLNERADWVNQLDIMRDSKYKAELESIDIDGEYLVKTYLPNKLRYASWL